MVLFGKKPRKGGKKTQRPPKSHARKGKFPKLDKRSKWRYISAVLFTGSLLSATVIGIFVLIGCSSVFPQKSLYLAEFRTNTTSDVRFGFGYFGGCVSIANITQVPGLSAGDSDESDTYHHCLSIHSEDNDDLEEEFLEDIPVGLQDRLKPFLSHTLPIARHLQKDVFHWSAPLASLVLFVIGGIMLPLLSINPTPKRVYKVMVVLAVLVSAFAFALAFTSTLGSLHAMNELMNGDKSKREVLLDEDIFIERGTWLSVMQEVQLGLVALCYIFIGFLYMGPSTRHHEVQA